VSKIQIQFFSTSLHPLYSTLYFGMIPLEQVGASMPSISEQPWLIYMKLSSYMITID